MSSPNVNSPGSPAVAAVPPTPEAGTQPETAGTGSFKDRDVAVVASEYKEAGHADGPDFRQMKQWQQSGDGPKETAAAGTDFREAAKSAGSKGLLHRIVSTVRRIIAYFIPGSSSLKQFHAEGIKEMIRQQDADRLSDASFQETAQQKQSMGRLINARMQIGEALKKIENPEGKTTLAVVKQAAARINLEDVRSVAEAGLAKNAYSTVGEGPGQQRLADNFNTAARLFEDVCNAKIDLAGGAKRSLAEIMERARDSRTSTAGNLTHHQDKALRNWLVHALSLADRCAQAMGDAAAGRDSGSILATIEHDLQQLARTPAIDLPDKTVAS